MTHCVVLTHSADASVDSKANRTFCFYHS